MAMVVLSVAMITSQQATSAVLPAKQRPLTTPMRGTRPERREKVVKVVTTSVVVMTSEVGTQVTQVETQVEISEVTQVVTQVVMKAVEISNSNELRI
jgi:hypothetical protein